MIYMLGSCRQMVQTLQKALEEVARKGDVVYYEQIRHLSSASRLTGKHFVAVISDELGEMARDEHEMGRPLLPVVVVSQARGEGGVQMPGQGFFTVARELGVFVGGSELDFFRSELARVYQYWQSVEVRQRPQ